MLEGQDILCFAPEPWDSLWRNRHQIMSRLARRNRVLFVEPRPYLRQVLRAREPRASGPRLRHLQDGLHIYRPPQSAPVSGRQPLKALFDARRRRSLLEAMARVGMCRPILWLCRPWQADVVGRYNERLLIYHVVDQYAAYEEEFADQVGGERLQAIAALDEKMVRQADLTIVTSPALLEAKRGLSPHVHLVRNGVDIAAFAAALSAPSPPPADIAALPAPIVAIAGVVNEKINLALLRDLARARPQWSLAFIGPVSLRFDKHQLEWLDLPNVHFLGHKPVEMLPHYIAASHVCLMPYKINEWTHHIDPLKMYEYLAAGKPVVSTDIPSARAFSPPLQIAHDTAGFVSGVETALTEASDTQSEAARRLASLHSWEERVEQISALVEEALLRTEAAACR